MFKIFVGNLGQDVAVDDVRQIFERHATIEDIALPADENGKVRGFAIVMIKDPQQGRLALMAARGARLRGRMLIINQARKKGKAPPKRGSRRASFRGRSSGMYGVKSSGGGGPSRFGGGSTSGSSRPDRPDRGDRPSSRPPRPQENDRGEPRRPAH